MSGFGERTSDEEKSMLGLDISICIALTKEGIYNRSQQYMHAR